jgi:hypothetical protein
VYRYISSAIVTAALSVSMAVAATPAIGVALSEGTILVNNAQTPGNATVFNGTTLQTQQTSSQVRLKSGAQVRFDLDSRGTLFTDHVDLQQGSARISDFAASASGLNVRAMGDSSASVTMKDKVVQIAALTGSVQVFNAEGLNVANLLPGRAVELPQDAGAAAAKSDDANKKKKAGAAAAGGAAGGGTGAGVSTGVIVGVGLAAAAGVGIGVAYGVGAIGGSTPCVPTSSQPCPS